MYMPTSLRNRTTFFEPIGTHDCTEHRRPASPRRDFPRGTRTDYTTRGVRVDPLAPFRDFTEGLFSSSHTSVRIKRVCFSDK